MRTISGRLLVAMTLAFPVVSWAQDSQPASRPATSRPAASRPAGQLEFFARFDKNHDGFLSQSEIPQRHLDRLMPFDLNEDGKLSQEEYKASVVPVNKPKPDFADVSYGPDKSMLFDLWKAKSDKPTPLVVHIHGGGFRSGDKRAVRPEIIDGLRKAGISVASLNYRMGAGAQLPVPMYDSARAIQFIRLHAAEYNIDPTRIGCTGGSAGAGISLWLAFHPDMAKKDAADPLEQQSTRLTCAAVFNAQTSYDPREMMRIMQGPMGQMAPAEGTASSAPATKATSQPGSRLGARQSLDLNNAKQVSGMSEASPMRYVSADDPPVWLGYSQGTTPPKGQSSQNGNVHTPNFGFVLKKVTDPMGVPCIVKTADDYPAGKADSAAVQEAVEFFIQHLQGSANSQPVQ